MVGGIVKTSVYDRSDIVTELARKICYAKFLGVCVEKDKYVMKRDIAF